VFNKRGKLKDEEIRELARTKKSIFSWLKRPPPPMAKVMEFECQGEVENMDVVNAVREDRLERVRIRQLEWACKIARWCAKGWSWRWSTRVWKSQKGGSV
jgi:hypothetical protein